MIQYQLVFITPQFVVEIDNVVNAFSNNFAVVHILLEELPTLSTRDNVNIYNEG